MVDRSNPGRSGACGCALVGVGLVMASAAPQAGSEHAPHIEEIYVEAARPGLHGARTRAADVPGGVTVVSIEQLQQRSVLSLADMLRYVPGIWSASSAGADDVFISSRGSNLDASDYDGNGVKLLQDGLPVTTADGNNHNRVIDPLSARVATFARGANGMAYGASTLGGAIDFVSPTAPDQPGLEIRLSGGSHGLGTLRTTAAGVFDDTYDGLVTVEAKTWDGYRDHSEQDRHGLYGNLGWRLGESLESRFFGTYVSNDQQLPGSLTRSQVDGDPDQASQDARGGDFQLNVDTWRIANRTTWQLGPAQRLDLGASLEQQALFHPIVDKVLVDPDGPGPTRPVEVFSLLIDTDQRNVGAMLRFSQRLGTHDLLLGVNYGHSTVNGGHFRNDSGHRNGLTNRIDNRAATWELFAQDHWQLSDRLTLVLALQGVDAERDTRDLDTASGAVSAPSGAYSAINPRIGVLYRLGASATGYANLSRLYEPPTNYELEDDIRGSELPLDAMTGTVAELGTRGVYRGRGGSRWHWDASVYYARIEDEILSVEDPQAPGTNLATNVDETIHAGIEVLLGGELYLGADDRHSLEPTVSVVVNHFEFDGDPTYGDNRLPAAPDYVLRGELLYRHPGGFHVGPTFDVVGPRWADFGNTFEIDGYELVGLRGGWDGPSWRAFVELQNLLDADHVATHNVRALAPPETALLDPGPPRSVYVGVMLSF
jgi:iron complex outermembrane recepter protein